MSEYGYLNHRCLLKKKKKRKKKKEKGPFDGWIMNSFIKLKSDSLLQSEDAKF